MWSSVGGEGQAEDPGHGHSSVAGAQQTGPESEDLNWCKSYVVWFLEVIVNSVNWDAPIHFSSHLGT